MIRPNTGADIVPTTQRQVVCCITR